MLDALYANGPVMTQLTDYGYGGFLVLKKEKNEPLKEALTLWEIEGRCESYQDPDQKEHVEFWDVDDIETLTSYKGKIRAVRAVVTKPDEDPSTWCFAIIGQRARQLGRRTALQIIRSRWHIENTAFQSVGPILEFRRMFFGIRRMRLWPSYFFGRSLSICFSCSSIARLGRCRRPKDPTDTIRHIVEVMLREVATLPEPHSLGDSPARTPADAAPEPR